MLFNSLHYAVFFPIVLAAFFAVPKVHRWAVLLFASYYFYMAWNPPYAAILAFSTLVDYAAARRMAKEQSLRARRPWLWLSVCSNLGLLFFFKYYDFVAAQWRALVGGDLPPEAGFLLPVGISFYTFQTLSYTIEVYRGTQTPEPNLGRFALYVSFFPQLVAGPIERPSALLPQLRDLGARLDLERIRDGLAVAGWGLFKKLVIADRLALVVDTVYGAPESRGGPALVIATIFFAFQIYCDFSGYCDIAIGCARCFGVELRDNFRRPYLATSVADFWRRWHISLSTWFRDYVYLPLGGRRVSDARAHLNLLIVFILSGAWHGANWTFLAWGALHAVYMIAERLLSPAAAPPEHRSALHRWLAVVRTFVLVNVGWVFFRAESISDAFVVFGRLFGGWGAIRAQISQAMLGVGLTELLLGFASIALLLGVQIAGDHRTLRTVWFRAPWFARWASIYVLVFFVLLFGVFGRNEFIYFRF